LLRDGLSSGPGWCHDGEVPLRLYERVVDEYESGRPDYPEAVYDALGPLTGLCVLEGGAGTGIATRALLERGAGVVPFDVAPRLLARARAATTGLPAVLADGARLPFRDACADLLCFAQSWHWLDESRRAVEASRVLTPGGRWAGWWSHARADGEEWFDESWSLVETTCPGVERAQRDVDWGADLAASCLFEVGPRITVPWVRRLSVDHWLTDQRSHSYIESLPAAKRDRLVGELKQILRARFGDGFMDVRYETWLWLARREDRA
jgi:SAM-dependent methyltransferase